MKITKKLKYAEFEWDEESKSFMITEEDGNRVILNKVYAFAFMRFVVRMAQRNWLRKQTGSNKKTDKEETMDLVFEFKDSGQEELDLNPETLTELRRYEVDETFTS